MTRKILIVDDDATSRKLLCKMLEHEYDVVCADSGTDALHIARRECQTLSAVLLDLNMPCMDGFEVLTRLRDDAELARVPVIVETVSNDEDTRVRSLTAGANDFIAKPYNPAIVLHCLRNNITLAESASRIRAMQRDTLTGIYVRDAFFEQAAQMVQQHQPGYYMLSCLDIDRFKVINDQYGTDMGDRVLKYVAACLKRCTDSMGGICCRMMADDFAVLYPASYADSRQLADVLCQAAAPEFLDHALRLLVGRYRVTDLSLTASAMYDRAVLAADSIHGRDDVHVAEYDEAMRQRLLYEQQIVTEMHAALRSGQFEMWLQPQYNHATGSLVGAEALARWRRKDGALIPPTDFIPVFERNGFIYELDKYIWEQACRLLRSQLDRGRNVPPISVNVSRCDILHPDFVSVISGLVQRYSLPVRLLRLEVTESAFSDSMGRIAAGVKQLIDLGFTVEIDDFGSGYSSLNALNDVPAAVLKLDMRFLEKTDNSQREGSILESVVRMARWLGMSVLAEGVETRQQADFLRSIGCIYVQGYLYARPMTAADYNALLAGAPTENMTSGLETVENFDSNEFWSPSSLDSLIFNSFVGGACIFEFRSGNIELLRSTDKFARMLGGESMNTADVMSVDWVGCLDAPSYAHLQQTLRSAVETNKEFSGEYRYIGLPNGQPETYLRSTMRVIARTGERCLVYSTSENITVQRLAERKLLESAAQLTAIMEHVGSGITAVIASAPERGFLFANDRFYELFGYTRERYEREVADISALIHPDDRVRVRNAMAEANGSEHSVSVKYRAVRPDGKLVWLSAIMSECRFPHIDSPVQLTIFNDVTDETLAQQQIAESNDQLRFLNDAAHSLLSQPDMRRVIDALLCKTLDYFGAARAYVFEIDRRGQTMSNTYEQCAPGAFTEMDALRGVPLETISFWLHVFGEHNCVDIQSVEALSDSRPEKALLLAKGIKALFAAPLMRDGRLIGFIGVDDPSRHSTHISRLAAIGDYVAVMLTRRDLNTTIERDSSRMQTLANDIPGGFVRLRLRPGALPEILQVNDGFCRLTGATRDEVTAFYAGDLLSYAHPDDAHKPAAAAAQPKRDGGQFSTRFRLRCPDGTHIWALVLGRFTPAGEDRFLNLYITDITAQVNSEDEQKEMLDNLPCGAGLFDFDGQKLTGIHVNKRYQEMVGRTADPSDIPSPLDVIHPDDRERVDLYIAKTRLSDRAEPMDLRIRHADGDYHAYRLDTQRIDRGMGRWSVCVTFLPMPDVEITMQQMMPHIFPAITEASADLTFAKDADFRYLCCSRAFARAVGVSDESEIVGKTDYDLFPIDMADSFRAHDAALLANGKPLIDLLEQMPSRNVIPSYCRMSKYPLRDASGRAIGIYGIGRDVTQNREAFAQLKLLANSIPGGLATFACSATEVRMIYCNDSFCGLFGVSRNEYEAAGASAPLIYVFEEDRTPLIAQYYRLLRKGSAIDCICRIHVRDGGQRWINFRAAVADHYNGSTVVNAVLLDISAQQEALERLRISEEENRIAIMHSGNMSARFDVLAKTLSLPESPSPMFALPPCMDNMPQGMIDLGLISSDTEADYAELFNSITRGSRSGSTTFRIKSTMGWRWLEAQYTTIFSAAHEPVSAVISFVDVTERLEKEVVYAKWQQSLRERPGDSYTLFRCNLSKGSSFDSRQGDLLWVEFSQGKQSFDERTVEYAEQCVFAADRERYIEMMRSDALLADYHRGNCSKAFDFRERMRDGRVRWLRLSVDLVEYPNSKDIEVHLMYEDIDDRKRAELLTKERSETDPLTGVLNRATFIARVDEMIAASAPGESHSLLMVDVDDFKQINDTFGHVAGDHVLRDLTSRIRSVLREEDLLGRLGGDEFFVFLKGISGRHAAAAKARAICALSLTTPQGESAVTTSVGIATVPHDGRDFDTLYKNVDEALYHAKRSGKNGYLFYGDTSLSVD